MGRNRRKAKGTASLTFLLLLVLMTGLLSVLGNVLWQQLAAQRQQLQVRQWAQLFTSFCTIHSRQPVGEKAEQKDLVTVQLTPRDAPLTIRRETLLSGQNLIRQETLALTKADGSRPMLATRYGLVMPGQVAGRYPDGSCWQQNEAMKSVDVPWETYGKLQKQAVMPDTARLEKAIAGYLYVQESGELVLPDSCRLQGRGVFVSGDRVRMGRRFRLKGDFRIFSRQDVVIGDDVALDKVFIFSEGSIKIGKNSQVKGILAAKGAVKLEDGASILEDRSVLEPFCTLYL